MPASGPGPSPSPSPSPLPTTGVDGVKLSAEAASFPRHKPPRPAVLGFIFSIATTAPGNRPVLLTLLHSSTPICQGGHVCTPLFYNDLTTAPGHWSTPHSRPSPFPPLPGCSESPFQMPPPSPCLGVALLSPSTPLQSPREGDGVGRRRLVPLWGALLRSRSTAAHSSMPPTTAKAHGPGAQNWPLSGTRAAGTGADTATGVTAPSGGDANHTRPALPAPGRPM